MNDQATRVLLIEDNPGDADLVRLRLVESKSLKLYLGRFRQFGEFHESCVNRIANYLITVLDPEYLKVQGRFTPRGGIPLWPQAEYTRPANKADIM